MMKEVEGEPSGVSIIKYEAEFFCCPVCGGEVRNIKAHQIISHHQGEPISLGVKEYIPTVREGIENKDLILEIDPRDNKTKYKHVPCQIFLRFPTKEEKEDRKAQTSYLRRLICEKCGQRFNFEIER